MGERAKLIKRFEFLMFGDSGENSMSSKDQIGKRIQITKFDTSSQRQAQNYKLYEQYFGDSLRSLYMNSKDDSYPPGEPRS